MKPKPSNRARKRGAALVEAAVAIPVMLVFLGTTMFAHRSYDEKIALQMSARSEILYNASHNCAEQAPSEMSRQLGAGAASSGTSKESGDADTTEGNGGAVDGTSSKLPDDAQSGVSRSWNLVKTSRQTTADGSAVQEQKTVKLNRTITANAEVACNEKRFDNDWTAIFGFIKGFAQSGGGFID
jgi:hypothetical protein